MFSRGELLDRHRTFYMMVEDHGFTYEGIMKMTPFEYELNTILILEHLEKLKKARQKGKPL